MNPNMPQRGGRWPESCGFALVLMQAGVLTLGSKGHHGAGKLLLMFWVGVLRLMHPRMGDGALAAVYAREGLGRNLVAEALT